MYNKVYQFPIELKQINTIIYILTRKNVYYCVKMYIIVFICPYVFCFCSNTIKNDFDFKIGYILKF